MAAIETYTYLSKTSILKDSSQNGPYSPWNIFLKTQYLVLNDSSILNYIITGNVHIANKNKNCEQLQSQLFYIKIV